MSLSSVYLFVFFSPFRPFVNEEELLVRSVRIRLHSIDTDHVAQPFETLGTIVVELGLVTCEEENKNCPEEKHDPCLVVVVER